MRTQTFAQPIDQGMFTSSATVLILWAGLIHLVIAVLHGSHGPAHDGFHLLAFGSQVALAAMLWRRPSRRRIQFALALVGGMLAFYALASLLPAPFPTTPEDVGVFGITSIACEALAGLILSAQLVLSGGARGDRTAVWSRLLTSLWAAALLGGVAYSLAGAAQRPAPLAPPAVAPAAVRPAAAGPDQLYWMSGGVPRPFGQGAPLAVAGDVSAAVTVNRSADQPAERDVQLQLYRATPADAVDNAVVSAVVHMGNMEHGTFKVDALHSAGGQYVLPIKFSMPGEWQADISIDANGEPSSLQLWLDLLQ